MYLDFIKVIIISVFYINNIFNLTQSLTWLQQTCCVKLIWRVSEASFVKKRFLLKISWLKSQYSILALYSMINNNVWTYLWSECLTSCVYHALASKESLRAREISLIFMNWYEKNFNIDINEIKIQRHFLLIIN